MITTVAPAKINWTLEVLGRRDDGYHEVRTVLQAIELHDELSAVLRDDGGIRVSGLPAGLPEDLVPRAADAFRQHHPSLGGVDIQIKKRIPVAAGLGGGSSDAAATIRLLQELGGSLTPEEAGAIAASLGSDVPFFLRGGSALGKSRGEQLTPLDDLPTYWLVLVVPALSIADKTSTMYGSLGAADFTDGARTDAFLSAATSSGIQAGLLYNAFERAAFDLFPELVILRDWMLQAGAAAVHLCGAGPSLFALASGEPEARAIRARLVRPRRGERVHLVRTVTAAESTLTWRT
jgi:4-diphosphocytidyl-2-C-methyl-D-erythritol kinase